MSLPLIPFFNKNNLNLFSNPFNRYIHTTTVAAFINLLFKHFKTFELNTCFLHIISYKIANKYKRIVVLDNIQRKSAEISYAHTKKARIYKYTFLCLSYL